MKWVEKMLVTKVEMNSAIVCRRKEEKKSKRWAFFLRVIALIIHLDIMKIGSLCAAIMYVGAFFHIVIERRDGLCDDVKLS